MSAILAKAVNLKPDYDALLTELKGIVRGKN